MLTRIFGPSRRELTGGLRQLCREKLNSFIKRIIVVVFVVVVVGRNSAGGTATHYGLDGPMIESRWGAIFSASIQTGPGVHPASYMMGTGSFPGVKRPGRGIDHPPPSSAEVKESVEVYLYSPSGFCGLL
jgi:hypothetical protein